jgi:hypothetical protein
MIDIEDRRHGKVKAFRTDLRLKYQALNRATYITTKPDNIDPSIIPKADITEKEVLCGFCLTSAPDR